MNISRIAVLGVAVLAGAAAFFLMLGNEPEQAVKIIQPVEEKTVRVLVADQNFARGERLTADSIDWIDWPEKALSESFLTEDAVGDLANFEGAVARSSIIEGEPIIEAKIVRAGSSGLLAAILQPGMHAVTMRVSPETSVGGFVLPGDRVDIHYSETGDDSATRTETLFENVRILAVNTLYSETPETSHVEGVNITLELGPADAEDFVNARSSRGQLSLALRSVFRPEGEIQTSKTKQDIKIIRYGRS